MSWPRLWLSADAAPASPRIHFAGPAAPGGSAARGLEVVTLTIPRPSFHAPVVNRASTSRTGPRANRPTTPQPSRDPASWIPDDAARGSVSTLFRWRGAILGAPNARVLARRTSTSRDRTVTWRTGPDERYVPRSSQPSPMCHRDDDAGARDCPGSQRFLGICLDLAHLACAWEQPADALVILADPIFRRQCHVSAASGVDTSRRPGTLRYYV